MMMCQLIHDEMSVVCRSTCNPLKLSYPQPSSQSQHKFFRQNSFFFQLSVCHLILSHHSKHQYKIHKSTMTSINMTRNVCYSASILIFVRTLLVGILITTSSLDCVTSFSITHHHNHHFYHHVGKNNVKPITATRSITSPSMIIISSCSTSTTQLQLMTPTTSTLPLSSTSLTTAVATFDGSTIADPVVVSTVFWSSLQTKIISVIIGQILATIVFTALTVVVSTQMRQIGTYVAKHVFKEENKEFVKENVVQFTESVKVKTQSPTISPDFTKLLFCLAIDIIGSSSELIPILGELTDVVWAPIAALALRSLFQGSNVIFALEFAEEFLPFTDILPLATICWVVETYFSESGVATTLGIGQQKQNIGMKNSTGDVIDVVPIKEQRSLKQ